MNITRTAHYDAYRSGNSADVQTRPQGGVVLMGGGKDVEDAFRWMNERSGNGDFLVLRASGADGYNGLIPQCGTPNSVESIVFKDREASFQPEIAERIDHAEAIFLAGGNQALYMDDWKDTPVQAALQRAVDRGTPIGGTSAGLAVLGEQVFAAHGGGVESAAALQDPFTPRMDIQPGLLHLPHLEGVLTDTHFSQRDRMGRLVTFLARTEPAARGIGVDERTAVLLDPDGQGRVVGDNSAYFVAPTQAPSVCQPGLPLAESGIGVQQLNAGDHFDFNTWQGDGQQWQLSAADGELQRAS